MSTTSSLGAATAWTTRIVTNLLRTADVRMRGDDWLPYYEERVHGLATRLLAGKSELVRALVDSVSDDEIIHQKGERPELVVERGDGVFVQRGTILQMKIYYAEIIEQARQACGTSDLASLALLDVGASSPLLFRLMGLKGIGLNISEGAVELMRRGGIEAHLGIAEKLPFADDSFDLVLCLNSFSHIDNPIMAMRELKRVARGPVIIANGYSTKFRFMDYQPDYLGKHRWGKFRWDTESFARLVAYCGLRIGHYRLVDFYSGIRDLSPGERVFARLYAPTRLYNLWTLLPGGEGERN